MTESTNIPPARALVRLAAEIRAREGGVYVRGTRIRLGTGQEIEAAELLAEHLQLDIDISNVHWISVYRHDTLGVLVRIPNHHRGFYAGNCVQIAIEAANARKDNPPPEVLDGPFPEIAALLAQLYRSPFCEILSSDAEREKLLENAPRSRRPLLRNIMDEMEERFARHDIKENLLADLAIEVRKALQRTKVPVYRLEDSSFVNNECHGYVMAAQAYLHEIESTIKTARVAFESEILTTR